MTADYATGSSAAESRHLDQVTIEEFGVPGLLLMEHASIGAATLALAALEESNIPHGRARVAVLCGPGNNGGDGYAVARHLHNAGVDVEIWDFVATVAEGTPQCDASMQRALARRWGIEFVDATAELPSGVEVDLFVDALFGTGLSRAPADNFAAAIRLVNDSGTPTLAIDIPSGLAADCGTPLGDAIRARWTATFGVVKKGFLAPRAGAFTGAVFCVPIGIPKELLPKDAPAFPPAPVAFAPRRDQGQL
ncbi:MAG: NAD(P)H-hydrate epimerase [Planctomycetota bacterium]